MPSSFCASSGGERSVGAHSFRREFVERDRTVHQIDCGGPDRAGVRFRRRNVQLFHQAPHSFTDSEDIIVRHLPLNRRGIVRMHPEWRGRTGVGHGVLSLRKQLVDVLKSGTHMPLMMFAETMRFCLVIHFSYRRCLPRPRRLTPACACDRDAPTRASPRLLAGKTFAQSTSARTRSGSRH